MKKNNKTEAVARLREKAEELLKKKLSKTVSKLSETERKKPLKAGTQFSEADTQRLVHELEVHQIELELENEELRLAKKQAETSSEKFTELFDFAPSGYFTLSKEGKIIELNLSGAKMLGQERTRLVNRRFGLYVSADTRQVFNDFLEKVFKNKITESSEVTFSANGNLPMYVHLSGTVTDHGEKCLVTAIDITVRKQAEVALNEAIALTEAALDSIHNGILVISANGSVIKSNTKFAEMWRIPEDILALGDDKKLLDNVISQLSDPEEFIAKVEELYKQPEKESSDIVSFKDGRIFERLSKPMYLGWEPIARVWSFLDITERKKGEETLRKSEENLRKINAEKDKFFSIIAHDLRSPFNGFLGLTEIMAEGLHGMTLDEIQEIAVSLKNSAAKLYNLLGNLLEWSRMQRGLTAFEPRLILLMPKITESMALVTEAAYKKEIAISYDIPEYLSVFADGNMFEGIIRNLSSNAVKFTPKGGSVYVSAKSMPDNSVEISVKDTGIGMNKEMTDNIFRLDVNTSRKGTEGESSTGLGLIICKDFIEKHGGKLRVESEERKGSTFCFTIPGKVQSNAGEHFEVVSEAVIFEAKKNEIKDLKILIAEDDLPSEMFIRKAIKTISKEVIKVRTGIEAIEMCRNNPDIDVVLMDIQMPGMDGYEATRQIRKFNKDVVIISQTALVLTGERENSIKSGCNDYISKPILKDELMLMIKKHLGNRQERKR
jgi:PAS domain S-box-containing protein